MVGKKMTIEKLCYRLARYRTVLIDDSSAGRPLRVAIGGRPLKSRPGRVWASTIAKGDRDKTLYKAGRMLHKIASELHGGFSIHNDTEQEATMKNFPTVPAKGQISVHLKDNGCWTTEPMESA